MNKRASCNMATGGKGKTRPTKETAPAPKKK